MISKDYYHQIIDKLSINFSVNSLLTQQSDFIFILESPHVQELKHGVPVAGTSGGTMSKNLFGEQFNKPLGLLLKKNLEETKNRPTLNRIGLVNVSNIPMQKAAYHDKNIQKEYAPFFEMLEAIRTSNQKDTYKDEELNLLQHVLIERFNDHLKPIINRKCTIIPCGKFAQKFFRLANVKGENWNIIDDVPHPSYNSWSRERYAAVIQKVKDALYN
ncbi:hypothetical protein [Bacillus taeanensis]|uniref:Uracil-DNA glycosylase-like domain-containing protein n=1 Tax=Bacillus taeanensis TaxID=273032 RepID=A0A366XUR2_9BACI|nr:hypothetical protein [Bacillus taeanensis]RBW67701.1 hypothetical protein DS031_20730 [Bacillus taeanensis]